MAQAALATASDRSARLQASRLQARQASQAKSSNNRTFQTVNNAASTLGKNVAGNVASNVIDLEAYRRARFIADQASQRLGQSNNPPTTFEDLLEEEIENDETNFEEQLQQGELLQFLSQTMRARKRAAQQAEWTAEQQKEIDKTREFVKKEAKAAIRRGAIWVVDLIAASLDLGSAGVAFLVDIFIYLFTLGWLNVEMIYGTHIAKKKSKYISPISWAPIPMPVDKEAIWLQSFIVAADILVGVVIASFMFFAFCWIHDYIQIWTNPFVTAAEGGANLCLGQAILTVLGFF